MDNRGIAQVLSDIADLLEIKGDNAFKIRAYRTAADTIDYEFTVNDPTFYTRPWTASLPMAKFDGPIYEYACHEGNHGLAGILSGARAEEAAAAKPK